MYWVEVCNDAIYWANGQEHTIPGDSLIQIGATDGEYSADHKSSRFSYLYEVETEHGDFSWEVEIIEYLEPAGATMLGFTTTEFPSGVVIKEPITFQLQDGWLEA